MILLTIFGWTVAGWKSGKAEAATVWLGFKPENLVMETGQTGSSGLRLEPAGEQVVGVDAIVSYNPGQLKLVEVKKGELFGQIVASIIDNEKGVAKLAFSNNYGVKTRKPGTVATLVWQRLAGGGIPVVKLEFIPGDTRDTNVVVAGGREVLGGVGTLTVIGNRKQEDKKQGVEATPIEQAGGVLGSEQTLGVVGDLRMPDRKLPGAGIVFVGVGLLLAGGGWWVVESMRKR